MNKVQEYFFNATEELFNFLDTLDKKIKTNDNTMIGIMEKDLEGIISKLEGDDVRKFADSIGFFERMKMHGELKQLYAEITNLESRFSTPNLYLDTCKLGIKILKENFDNKININKFNENYQECQYFKNKYIQILK